MKSGILGISVAVLAAWLVGGCSTSGFSIPWVKQGPGTSPEEARATRQDKTVAAPEAANSNVLSAVPVSPPAKTATDQPRARAPALASAAPTHAATEQHTLGSGYTQAARYGDMLFISGQIAMDLRTREVAADKSIEEQTATVLENVRAVLEAHSLTMANVVSTTIYLKNINDLRAMDGAYSRFFKGALPARTVVEVSRLPRGALVEISAIAGR